MKIAEIMGYIYGVGIMIALFVGALTFIGYLVALFIGGESATQICVFIYKKVYPVLFSFSSVVVLFGLVKMYVAGEKSMASNKKYKNLKPQPEVTEEQK